VVKALNFEFLILSFAIEKTGVMKKKVSGLDT